MSLLSVRVLPLCSPLYPFVTCFKFNADANASKGNILPDSTAAPALQGNQRQLEKHMRKDSLEQKIQNRPKPDELVKEGILEADENPLKE